MKTINTSKKSRTALILLIFLIGALLISCNRTSRDIEIVPPSAPPLSRTLIGYGILINSYTHILTEPRSEAVSLGYLREGSVVPILERKMITQNNKTESWVFVKGIYEGWLKENAVAIYENEAQAKTAAESLP